MSPHPLHLPLISGLIPQSLLYHPLEIADLGWTKRVHLLKLLLYAPKAFLGQVLSQVRRQTLPLCNIGRFPSFAIEVRRVGELVAHKLILERTFFYNIDCPAASPSHYNYSHNSSFCQLKLVVQLFALVALLLLLSQNLLVLHDSVAVLLLELFLPSPRHSLH